MIGSHCYYLLGCSDEESPALSCPADIAAETDKGQNFTTVNWTVSAHDAVSGDIDDITCVDDKGNEVVSGGAFDFGVTNVTCTATDGSGNTGMCSFAVNVTGR